MRRIDQHFWVAQQLELALSGGFQNRISVAIRKLSYRRQSSAQSEGQPANQIGREQVEQFQERQIVGEALSLRDELTPRIRETVKRTEGRSV